MRALRPTTRRQANVIAAHIVTVTEQQYSAATVELKSADLAFGQKAEPIWHNFTAKVLAGCREVFSKTCPAGKTTAVVEGGAFTARDILRPVGANIRNGKPPRRAQCAFDDRRLSSGLSATGTNQAVKQLVKKEEK